MVRSGVIWLQDIGRGLEREDARSTSDMGRPSEEEHLNYSSSRWQDLEASDNWEEPAISFENSHCLCPVFLRVNEFPEELGCQHPVDDMFGRFSPYSSAYYATLTSLLAVIDAQYRFVSFFRATHLDYKEYRKWRPVELSFNPTLSFRWTKGELICWGNQG